MADEQEEKDVTFEEELDDILGSVEEDELEAADSDDDSDDAGDDDSDASDSDDADEDDEEEGDSESGGDSEDNDADDSGDREADDDEDDEGEEEDELTTYKTQNELLLKRLEALEGKQAPKPETSTEAEAEEAGDDVPQFLTDDDDIDAIISNKDKLNEFALRVFNKAIEVSGARAKAAVNTDVPEVVVKQVQNYLTLREGINEFFGENKDLLVVRKTVGAITNDVVAEHGDWTLTEVLTEVEKRTREATGIKKRKEETKKRKRNPALGSGTGGRKKSSDRRTAEQKEIDDIL